MPMYTITDTARRKIMDVTKDLASLNRDFENGDVDAASLSVKVDYMHRSMSDVAYILGAFPDEVTPDDEDEEGWWENEEDY